MCNYLIKLTPLEPYFFGGENTFLYGEPNHNYYITSLTLPPATSVIGMMRYTLLEQAGLLRTDGKYGSREEIEKLIGKSSYCAEGTNDFGKIKSISPLFIMDGSGNKYVPTPLNHKTSEQFYTPFRMSTETVLTSHGRIHIPAENEFNAKNTVHNSFMDISDGSIHNDIIITDDDSRTGIDKDKEKGAFFKKAYCRLKDDYCFAFTAEIDFELRNTVCYMGRERSPFAVTIQKCDENYSICEELKTNTDRHLQHSKKISERFTYGFYYALSDLIIRTKPDYTDFAMVNTDSTRMLTTTYTENGIHIKRHQRLYNVIKAGSIFMSKPSELYGEGFGLNTIIKLGGENQ